MQLLIPASAYLLGSVPWAYIIGRWVGHDVRQLGDGNGGAHNVMRHVGRGWGLLVLLLDVSKGAAAVLLARAAGGDVWLPVLAGWLAVLGHTYPLWLRFDGGKGLSTSLGVMLGLAPHFAWLVIGGALVTVAATRNLAFSSVVVGVLLMLAAWLRSYPLPLVLAPLGLLLLMGWRQLPDLRRMWRESPNKRDLVLNRWLRDRDAKL
jgi:glycerol-3-phosphate acyltransferase PlsY